MFLSTQPPSASKARLCVSPLTKKIRMALATGFVVKGLEVDGARFEDATIGGQKVHEQLNQVVLRTLFHIDENITDGKTWVSSTVYHLIRQGSADLDVSNSASFNVIEALFYAYGRPADAHFQTLYARHTAFLQQDLIAAAALENALKSVFIACKALNVGYLTMMDRAVEVARSMAGSFRQTPEQLREIVMDVVIYSADEYSSDEPDLVAAFRRKV